MCHHQAKTRDLCVRQAKPQIGQRGRWSELYPSRDHECLLGSAAAVCVCRDGVTNRMMTYFELQGLTRLCMYLAGGSVLAQVGAPHT